MREHRFTILGDPRTKGNSPVIVRGGASGRVLLLPSPAYLKWLKAALAQLPFILAKAPGLREPIAEPMTVSAIFWRKRKAGDEDNHKKGLGDYLQRARLIKNDRLIHWGEVRIERDPSNPRVDVLIEVGKCPEPRPCLTA